MNAVTEMIIKRLVFDGLMDESIELNQIFEIGISDTINSKNDFKVLIGEEIGLEMNDLGGMLFIVIINSMKDYSKLMNEIYRKANDIYSRKYTEIWTSEPNYEFKCTMYFFFNQMQERFIFESSADLKKLFSSKIYKEDWNIKKKRLRMSNFHVVYDSIPKQEVISKPKIRVLSRVLVSRNETKDRDSQEIEGTIYAANLRDIVSLFEYKSNDLFKKNIRFGIGEKNSVDYSIKETLRNDPNMFWFLNNGVTLHVDGKIDLSKKDYIQFDTDDFSVINGAQTITSSAKFFLTGNEEIEKLEEAEKNAYVLLRVLNGKHKQINDITVGLNRQKPITAEDINFINREITYLNGVLADTENSIKLHDRFQIVRRGEAESINAHYYSLVTVVRMITAIKKMNPGAARTKSTQQLLENMGFKLFDFIKTDSVEVSYLPKHIGFINFAMKSEDDYRRLMKDSTIQLFLKSLSDEVRLEFNAIMNYGKYHILSGYINAFCKDGDYSNAHSIPKLNDLIFRILLITYRKEWKHYCIKNKVTNAWDSNAFKTVEEPNDVSFIKKFIENLSKIEKYDEKYLQDSLKIEFDSSTSGGQNDLNTF